MALFKRKKKYRPVVGILCEMPDYRIYLPSLLEKILWFLIGFAVGGVVLYIFYESVVVSVVTGIVCGVAFIPIRTNQKIEKRKKDLTNQFRSMLDALATSIGAGRNMYEAFSAAADDLAVQFGADADIVNEVKVIRKGPDNDVQIEDMLLNFAARSGIEDIENFANVFATCYKKGANIKEVIKNSAQIIGDKIEVEMELQTIVAGPKNELMILLFMPILLVIVMKTMGGGLINLSTLTGKLSVTVSLVIFVLAYVIGQKIIKIKF